MKNELKVWEWYTSFTNKFSSVFLTTVLSLILMLCVAVPSYSADNKGKGVNDETNANSIQQSKTITGKVVDEDGMTLPGVSVVVKGTTTGTVTDIDGKYTINVSPTAKTLIFSFVGMTPQEITIGAQAQINVTLETDVISLGEVVAIGYGSMEKNNVTGAIASIKADEIMKAPVTNVVEALRGQVSGVKISRGSGQPGSGVEFLIRGKKSLTSGNEPLIVIDGVPITGGNLADINTADIATINILKDAAAASIYGASGANGVVLITTKDGVFGKPTINVEASYGLVDLAMIPTTFSGEEYVKLKRDALVGNPKNKLDPTILENVLPDPVEMANYKAGNSTNWHDLLLRQGSTKNISLSLSGGTEKFHYYMNGDAYLETGIVQRSTYNRYSFRLNADYAAYDFLTVGARVQVTKNVSDETGLTLYQGNADFGDFIGNSPLGRTHDENGNLVPTVKGDQFQYNPLWRYKESDLGRNGSRIFVNPWLELKIFDGLKYRMNAFAEERYENFTEFYSSVFSISALGNEPSDNNMTFQVAQNMTYLWDNILSYNKTFNEVHSVDATLVYGIQSLDAYTLRTTGKGSSTDLLGFYDINAVPSTNSTVSLSPNQWGKEYYVGRLGYSYNDRYNLTLTIRRDGSSKFGPGNRYGNFPSAAFAWNINNEKFMSGISNTLNTLKYRVSYGRMGNDNIRNFAYLATTNNASYVFNNTVFTGKTTDPSNPGNPYLKWETSNQFNTGLDFGLFQNRINGTIDYYMTNTSDLLLTEQLPSTTGATSVISNVGKTKNWGIDANINARIIDNEFKWDVTVNWAKDHNEIVSLSRYSVDDEGNPIDDLANGWFIGQDIDVIYDYKFLGIYQTGEEAEAAAMNPTIKGYGPGDAKIADLSGKEGVPDGKIDTNDKTFLGSATPSWYGGLRNTFSYKGLELTILIEAVQGVEKINGYYGGLDGRDNSIKVDYWTPENPSNVFPQPNSAGEYNYRIAVGLRDASFFSLRNISLGYTLPQNLVKKTPFKGLSLYLRGNNLKYFTDYTDSYSPEIDPWNYPITKTWTFSAKLTF
jgi:TonB-linked SusC/RagA family outer membrane protein